MRLSLILLLFGSILLTSCSKVSYQAYRSDRKAKVSKRYHKPSKRSRSTYAANKPRRSNRSRSRVSAPAHIDHVQLRQAIVSDAQAHLGTKYVYGGKRPGGFDCSGFTSYVLTGNGVDLRGSSRDQAKAGDRKPVDALAPGDLAFFGSSGKVTHVGIVKENTGDQLIVIHATTSAGVKEDDVLGSKYWRSRLLFGRDVLR